MNQMEHILGEYAKLFPASVVRSASGLQNGGAANEIGSFLETCLDHINTTLLVIGSAMVGEGDPDAMAAMTKIRDRGATNEASGVYLHYFDLWNDYEATRAVFDADVEVPTEEATTSSTFASLWAELRRVHGPPASWDLDVVNDEYIRQALATYKPKAQARWVDLVLPLIEFRNKVNHKDLGARYQLVPALLISVWRVAVLEVGVVGPAAALLRRYKFGEKTKGFQHPKRGMVDEWRLETTGGLILSPARQDEVVDLQERWLIDLEAASGDAATLAPYEDRWGRSIGPWRLPRDILRSVVIHEDFDIDGKGTASLTAGLVDIRTIDGSPAALLLPTSAQVAVTVDGRSATHVNDLRVGALADSRSLAAGHDQLEQLVRQTVGETLRRLSDSLGRADHRHVPSGISGTVSISLPSPNERVVQLGLRRALVLATARAIARPLVGGLPDPVQIGVLQAVLGVEASLHRDVYGWVDLVDRNLVGPPLPCPAAALLLLVPTAEPQRRRDVELGSAINNDDSDVSSFQGLVRACDRAATELDKSEPHPLLALLRPVRDAFGASGLLAAHDSWVAGLVFPPEDPRLDRARRHLERELTTNRLPATFRVVTLSTAASQFDLPSVAS